MNMNVVPALIKKDITLLFRNRVLSILPAATLVILIVVYYIMPRTVSEVMAIGVQGWQLPAKLVTELKSEGVEITYFDSEDALYGAIEKGPLAVGIIFPDRMSERLSAGEKPEITALFGATVLPEVKKAELEIIKQMILTVQGKPDSIRVEEEHVFGPDMAGRQITFRDRLVPLFAVFIIFMEIIGLGTLITEEYDRNTISSLLVTSLKIRTLLTAKSITGVGMTFVQAAILLAATGALFNRPLLLLTSLLLGSVLVVGIAFLIAAVSRDMMAVIAWSMLVMILLFLPALNIILPGIISGWMKIIPSYHLTDVMHKVVHFDAGWRDVWGRLSSLLLIDMALLGFGALAIRRKAI